MRQQIFESALQKILGEIVALDVKLDKEDPRGKLHALRAHETRLALGRIEKLATEALKRP